MDNKELAAQIALDSYARVRFGAEDNVRQWKDLNEDAAPTAFAEMLADIALAHLEITASTKEDDYDPYEDHMEGEDGDFALGVLDDDHTLSDWVRSEQSVPSYMCRFLGDKELKEFAEDHDDEEGHFEYLVKKRDEMLRLFRHSRRVAILARKLLAGEKVEQDLSDCLAKSGY